MKLVAGSYERFLWGYDVKLTKQELQWKFAYPAHIGSIKCIATCGAIVATGGADDTIRIFDLNAQKDMGLLFKHEAAVTCLDFHNSHPGVNHPTHLLSGSEDGSICIWDTDAWIHLLTMKAKKGTKSAVQDLSIHTSGLLALSIERNHTMKMWNLTKGRCSFTTRLPSEADIVKFFPQCGDSYALAIGIVLEIRDAETGSTLIVSSIRGYSAWPNTRTPQDNMLVTWGEDCIVTAWDTRSGKQARSVANAHTNRIMGVAILESKSDTDEHSIDSPVIVASASSDGLLKIWDTRMVGSEDRSAPVPLMQAETKARLTCLTSSSGFKKTYASVSISEVVPDKHRRAVDSNAELRGTGQVFKKKKRKSSSRGGETGDVASASSESKRLKKQRVNVNRKKQSKSFPGTPLSSIVVPDSNTSRSKSPSFRKRLSRDKSRDADSSHHKKSKLSSEMVYPDPDKAHKSGKKRKDLSNHT